MEKVRDYALSVAAQDFRGKTGYIAVAVLMATSSAINVTFYSMESFVYAGKIY